jgi:WXXGXW repeat (2 copies)
MDETETFWSHERQEADQMIAASRWPCLFLTLVAFPISACYVEARTRPVAEGELVYESEPPPPPPAEVEVVPVSPGPDFIWIGGYHRWEGRRYVWIRGHYERRPHPRARWVNPHWEARGRVHVWVGGRWE